jgi:UDP-4-amino-4,6-dideoxy-N-acetyl-beta-L-altrosamine N-acetyltransferase
MNVRMEHLREEHLAQVLIWRTRPDITRFMNTDPKLTLEDQKKWFDKISNDPSQKNWIIYVDDIPSGLINIFDIDRVNNRCSWGYYIAKLEVRSLKLAMFLEWNLYDYVFNVMKLNKLCNETFVLNENVIKLHKLCGSSEDGVLRQHIFKNGEYYDVSVGSILAAEWEQKKPAVKYEPFHFE